MLSKHAIAIILVAAVLAGPAIYFNDSWSRMDAEGGYPVGTADSLNRVPVHNVSFLSPSGLAPSVATVPVAVPNYQNGVNPSGFASINTSPPTPFPESVILPGDAAGPDLNAIPLEFMPIQDLSQIFRFDVTPAWVKERWDRVSNSAGGQGLAGLRVPLVTGVNTNDLFGSLTYYFDVDHDVQKITFRGWTGNADNLVNLVQSKYGFRTQPTSAEGLYLAGSSRHPTGVLYLQLAGMARSENPTQQTAILLEINNPHGPCQLSSETTSILAGPFH